MHTEWRNPRQLARYGLLERVSRCEAAQSRDKRAMTSDARDKNGTARDELSHHAPWRLASVEASVRTNSGWQWLTGLLADDVVGVPIVPVLVVSAGALLVLTMRRRRAPQRCCKLHLRSEGRAVSRDASR